jgi:hypothetical protein
LSALGADHPQGQGSTREALREKPSQHPSCQRAYPRLPPKKPSCFLCLCGEIMLPLRLGLHNFSRVRSIRIDVEGSEIGVFKGLENTHKHCRSYSAAPCPPCPPCEPFLPALFIRHKAILGGRSDGSIERLPERGTRTPHLLLQQPINVWIQGNRGSHVSIRMQRKWMRQDAKS